MSIEDRPAADEAVADEVTAGESGSKDGRSGADAPAWRPPPGPVPASTASGQDAGTNGGEPPPPDTGPGPAEPPPQRSVERDSPESPLSSPSDAAAASEAPAANAEDSTDGRHVSDASANDATVEAAGESASPAQPTDSTRSAQPPEAEMPPALDDANPAPEAEAPPSPGGADEARDEHGPDAAPPDATQDRASAQAGDDWLRLVEEGWDARDTDVTRIGEPRPDVGPGDLDDTGVADAALADTFVDGGQPVAPTVDMPIAPAAPPSEGRPKLRRSRRRARHRRRVRRGLRVRQRLWAIDPWSVFKVSLLFYVSVFLIVMVAGTLLWNVGRSSGTIERAEGFITGLGAYGECVDEADVPDDTDALSDADCPDGQVRIDGFELDDGTIFRVAAIGGAVLVVAGSVGNVLMVVLLNLINEVTGGLRHTVVREPVRRHPTRSNDLDVGG